MTDCIHIDYCAILAYERHLTVNQPHRVNWFLGLHPEDQMRLCGGWHENRQWIVDDDRYREEMSLGGREYRAPSLYGRFGGVEVED